VTAFRVSLSVSAVTELFVACGQRLDDGAREARTVAEIQQMLVSHGSTEVFYRLPTRRHACNRDATDVVIGSLETAVARAELAAALDLDFNPEIGLFCHYGDLPRQPPPDFSEWPEIGLDRPWGELTLEEMTTAVRLYTSRCADAIVDTGARVTAWDLGNEPDYGVAGIAPRPRANPPADLVDRGREWYDPPDRIDTAIAAMSVTDLEAMPEPERISWLRAHIWPYEAAILAAAAEGIRAVVPAARIATHLSNDAAVSPALSVAFWTTMWDGGYRPDILGYSFYPSAGPVAGVDRFTAFRTTVDEVRTAFDRPVFLSEYGYPAFADGIYEGWNHALPGYPLTEQGQAELLYDLTIWGLDNGLCGIRPWLPDAFVGAFGLNNLALFAPGDPGATVGRPRPALHSMARALGDHGSRTRL
jgi:hypothetical protein